MLDDLLDGTLCDGVGIDWDAWSAFVDTLWEDVGTSTWLDDAWQQMMQSLETGGENKYSRK